MYKKAINCSDNEAHQEIMRLIKEIPKYITPEQQQRHTAEAKEILEKGGCYIATAVYGSYNCPEVWTLRRFRDYQLANNWCGRVFIKTYYAISPTLVNMFGHSGLFKRIWRTPLDKLVKSLNKKGVSDLPYIDKIR